MHRKLKTTWQGAACWCWPGAPARGGWAWPAMTEHDINTYTDGTIVVSLVDAKTHREVWQGQAADVLSFPVSNPRNATKDINQAMAKIFTKYPPELKG